MKNQEVCHPTHFTMIFIQRSAFMKKEFWHADGRYESFVTARLAIWSRRERTTNLEPLRCRRRTEKGTGSLFRPLLQPG